MQQIQSALPFLPAKADAHAVDATSLGPAVPDVSGKKYEKQSDAGFSRVLEKEQSQAGGTGQQRSEQAKGEDRKPAPASDDTAAEDVAREPAGERVADGSGAPADGGKIMPPRADRLPPEAVPGDPELAVADAPGSGGGKPGGEASADAAEARAAGAIDEETARVMPAGALNGQTGGAKGQGGPVLPGQAAEPAISATQAGGNAEAARPEGRESGLGVRDANQASRPSAPVGGGESPEPERDGRSVSELPMRKSAVRERAELAPGRVFAADAGQDTQSVKPASSLAAAAPVSEAASSSSLRPGLGLQAGMEPPVGARIAVGQEGWSQLIAQRIANLAARGSHGAEIQLDPPDLGPIKVTIQMSGDQTASVTVQSHSQAVRDALEQSAHRLRELFNQSGLDLSSLDVSDQGLPRGHSEARGETAHGRADGSGEAGPDETASVDESPMAVVVPGSAGRIDFYI